MNSLIEVYPFDLKESLRFRVRRYVILQIIAVLSIYSETILAISQADQYPHVVRVGVQCPGNIRSN